MLFASALPEIVGVESLVTVPDVVNNSGFAGGVVSTSKDIGDDSEDIFPAVSIALTTNE